ncbi:MAG: hypothetical protein WCJ35_27885 [Planctomycetota bacterium]
MVKNITLSADETVLRRAREKAANENRSLNHAFREWLERYAGREKAGDAFDALLKRLSYVRPGRKLSREEMNER